MPLVATTDGFFAAKNNRKNIEAAQSFPEVPRFTPKQLELLDYLDEIMPSEALCTSMQIDPGDLQLLNSFVTLHSRSAFEDFDDPDQKRHLLRLWLSHPWSQPLPATHAEFWGDIDAGAVRTGWKGIPLSPEMQAFERRQAKAMKMKYEPFYPRVTKEQMDKIITGHRS